MKTKSKGKNILNSLLVGNKAVLIVIVLIIGLSILSPIFLTTRNLMNVLRQVCVQTIIACGFAMILGAGDIDLSIGSTIGFTGMLMAMLAVRNVPFPVILLAGIAVGVVIGFMNAFFVTTFGLTAFIVTMATQQIIRGACYLVSGMLPVTNLPESFTFIGQGFIGAIPTPVYVMILMVILCWILVNRTKYGRNLLAMGGNAEAAFVCGINVKRVRYITFMLTGAIAAIAGAVLTARSASAQPAAGLNMEMDAIAAAVIGGTSMDGGRVNIIGAFFGALIVGVVNNGLNLLGVDSNWQTVSKGVLILLAVILDAVTTWAANRRTGK